jgi:hypothetical protein
VPQTVSSRWEGSTPRPLGKLFDERPIITWQMEARRPRTITKFRLMIDGQSIPARYDQKTKAIIGTPERSLSIGEHKVHCEVWFDDDAGADMRWSFVRIAPPLPAPPVSMAQIEVFQLLNRLRRSLSLAELSLDPYLCHAATQHSRYLARNKLALTHTESNTLPEFYGETTEQRVERSGSLLACHEAISMGYSSNAEALIGLISAPYHRPTLIQPGALNFGVGLAGTRMTLLCGISDQTGMVVYPGENQRDVPLDWENTETPDPLRLYENPGSTVGYPISIHAFGPKSSLTFARAMLTDAQNNPIDCYLNMPQNDSELDPGMSLLVPKKPLAPNMTYGVQFFAKNAGGSEIIRSWKFTTRKK